MHVAGRWDSATLGHCLPRHAAAGHQLLHVPVHELRASTCTAATRGRSATSSISRASCRCSRSWWPGRSSGSRTWPTSSAARTHTLEKFARGVAFFALGMAKKILLANPVRQGRRHRVRRRRAVTRWTRGTGVLAYAFQIYFDFSGYSDMAIGLGLMLGFVFAEELRLALPSPTRSPSSGGAGTSRCRPGCATTSTSRSAATARARSAPTSTCARHAARRPVARRGLELRRLGRHPRRAARVERAPRQDARLPPPAARRTHRRAPSSRARHLGLLPRGIPRRGGTPIPAPCRAGEAPAARRSAAPVVYAPYLVARAHRRRSSSGGVSRRWTWTRTVGPPRAGRDRRLLVLALAALATQSYNPFIYFIF